RWRDRPTSSRSTRPTRNTDRSNKERPRGITPRGLSRSPRPPRAGGKLTASLPVVGVDLPAAWPLPRPPFLEVNREPHREPGQRHGQRHPAGRHPPTVWVEPEPLPSHLAQRPTVTRVQQCHRLRDRKPQHQQRQPKWPPAPQPPRVTLGHRCPPPRPARGCRRRP